MITHELTNPGLGVVCKRCGHEYVHFKGVHTFMREGEDQGGQRVAVRRKGVKIDKEMEHNPSDRRNGVVIYLMCESCKKMTKLCIAEHKGLVYIETEVQT